MQQFILAVCVTCLVLVGTNGSPEDCVYRLQQCYTRMTDMEQKVNSVEANQAIIEGRQSAIVSELLREMNITKQDTKTVKTVVNTLVEDNVKMHGEMRMLNGVGYDVMRLRTQMTSLSQKMATEIDDVKGQVTEVSQSMQQESEAQIKVSALMSSQMNKNNQLLEELQSRFAEIEARLNRLEGSKPTGNSATEQLQGMMDELTARMDGFQDFYGKKIEMLTQELNSRHAFN